MKRFFRYLSLAVLIVAGFAAPGAHAQFVVDAPTADAELTTANVTLGAQLTAAAKTAVSSGEAVVKLGEIASDIGSGATVFGNLAFQSNDSLPGDGASTLDLTNGSGAASDSARSIQKQSSSIGEAFFSKVKPFAKNLLSGDMNSASSAMAANEDVYEKAKLHTTQLETLRTKIATTVSVKDALDLNARIQLETADVTNELVKVQALENMEGHSDQVRQQKTKQSLFGRNSRSY